MNHSAPHFRLFSESNAEDQPGRWRFRLQLKRKDGRFTDDYSQADAFEAGGNEPDVRGERLELLCVVRGLEALDQPSRVTLVTESAYVREGIRYGLEQWRTNGWRWESFGRMVPVKNQDLWQRVDAALKFHQLECQVWRFDEPHDEISAPKLRESNQEQPFGNLRSPSCDDQTANVISGQAAEIGLATRELTDITPAVARNGDETRCSLLRYVMMRWLTGCRNKILDSAAQIGRVVGV